MFDILLLAGTGAALVMTRIDAISIKIMSLKVPGYRKISDIIMLLAGQLRASSINGFYLPHSRGET